MGLAFVGMFIAEFKRASLAEKEKVSTLHHFD
jgi:hypothetical protein